MTDTQPRTANNKYRGEEDVKPVRMKEEYLHATTTEVLSKENRVGTHETGHENTYLIRLTSGRWLQLNRYVFITEILWIFKKYWKKCEG